MADIRLASLVYVSTYCVPIALLRQNKPFLLLYLGHAQIIKRYLQSWNQRTWGVLSFCQENAKKLSRKIPNFVHITITRKKSDYCKALGPMHILQRLSTEAKKSLRINNKTSELNLRVASPKSLPIHCTHMHIVSIVCRATTTPQKGLHQNWYKVSC